MTTPIHPLLRGQPNTPEERYRILSEAAVRDRQHKAWLQLEPSGGNCGYCDGKGCQACDMTGSVCMTCGLAQCCCLGEYIG